MPVEPEQIAALIESPLRERIPRWEELPADPVRRVTLLRKTFPPDVLPAILELSELRYRARAKFYRPERMFFDREGLEQATTEDIATERGLAFHEAVETLADLTCGIGGDSIQFAVGSDAHVIASDISAARVAMARANMEAHFAPSGLECVTFRVAAAEDYPAAEGYFLDPSRRAAGKRSRHLAGLSPSADLILELSRKAKTMAAKLSPATPDEELALLGGSVEFVSHRGECKEAVVWYGACAPESSRTAHIVGGYGLSAVPGVPDPPISEPLRYLLEPDPAIIRAGLIPELCQKLNAAAMDPRIGYLTVDVPTPSVLVSCYEILRSLPFSLKAVRAALREFEIGSVEVKKRASAADVPTLLRQLQSPHPGTGTVILTRIGEKPWAFVCRAALRSYNGHLNI